MLDTPVGGTKLIVIGLYAHEYLERDHAGEHSILVYTGR